MDKKAAINLDANASFDLLPEVKERLSQLLSSKELRGLNPSSIHTAGQTASALIEEARDSLSKLVSLPKDGRVVFTSGATEANNLALNIPFLNFGPGPNDSDSGLITTTIEHPSVLETVSGLRRRGVRVALVNASRVTPGEVISAEDLAGLVDSKTELVSVMAANNETGHITPLKRIGELVKGKNSDALLHSDAVQILGRSPFSMSELGFDLISVSGHKLGALTGVGALIVSARVPQNPQILGGPQERRWRAGTENVLGIVSLGVAAEVALKNIKVRSTLMRERCQQLASEIGTRIPDARFISDLSNGLPNTLSISFSGVVADDLLIALDMKGVLCSSGAACSSGKPEPSHVLTALGLSEEEARSTLRFSLQGTESVADIESVTDTIRSAVMQMRSLANGGVSRAA